MKELYILDEPESKGYAYSEHGDMVHRLGEPWRPATRREQFRFEMTRPRLSIMSFLVGAIVYAILVAAAEALS